MNSKNLYSTLAALEQGVEMRNANHSFGGVNGDFEVF